MNNFKSAGFLGLALLLLMSAASTVTHAQNDADFDIATPEFERVWERTDRPLLEGNAVRTWIWGPGANTGLITEFYAEANGGQRQVQYFDKSRMEMPGSGALDPDSPWFVTQGLLATELMTGQVQLGDTLFQAHPPSQIPVGGDPVNNVGPTYAEMGALIDTAPRETGGVITEWIDPQSGDVVSFPALGDYDVTDAHFDSVTNHNVASVFWEFMNSSGLIFVDDELIEGPIFENPMYGVGRPRTEAYWGQVTVAEVEQDVLIQCFERRCLTYAPDNPEGWQVESGNIGQHYYQYRYHEIDLQDPVDPGVPADLTLEPASAGPLVVGEWHTVTVTALDAQGQAANDGTSIEIEVSGANSQSATRETENGSVTYSYIGEAAGIDQIVATYGSLTSNTGVVEWVHGEIDRVELVIDPVEQTIDETVSLSAIALDVFDNPVPNVDLEFTSEQQGNLGTFTTGANGEAAISPDHGSPTAGTETITATEPVSGASDSGVVTWTHGAPASIDLTQDDDVNPWGTEHTVEAAVVDQSGAIVPDFDGAVEFLIDGEVAGTESANAGQASFTYTGPAEDRVDTITARLAADHSVGEQSPLTKTWIAGDPVSLTLTHEDGSDDQASNPVTRSHTVIATVRNAGDVPMPGVSVGFSVSGDANPGAIGETAPDDSPPDNRGVTAGDGTVTFTYAGVNPGLDTIEATVPGTDLNASLPTEWTGVQISLSHEPADQTQRHVGEAHTILATVEGAGDTPLEAVLVRFDIDPDSPNSDVSGQAGGTGQPGNGAHYGWTNESGQVDFVYTGENTGTDTIHATVLVSPSVETSETDQIDVDWYEWSIALEHDDGYSEENPVGESHRVVATVDVDGPGPIGDIPVQFTVTGDGNPDPPSGSASTESDGTATFAFSNEEPGTNTIEAAIVDSNVEPATIQKHWAIREPASIELELIDPNPDFEFDAFDPDRQYLTFRATVSDQFDQPIQADHVRFTSSEDPSQAGDGFGLETGFPGADAESSMTLGTNAEGEAEIVFRRGEIVEEFPTLPAWGDVEISASLLDGPDGESIDADTLDVHWEQRELIVRDFSALDGTQRSSVITSTIWTFYFLPVPDGDLRIESELHLPVDCDPNWDVMDYLGMLEFHLTTFPGPGGHTGLTCIDGVYQNVYEISVSEWDSDEATLTLGSSGDIPAFIPVGITELVTRIVDDATDEVLASHTETFEIIDSVAGENEPELELELGGFDGVAPGSTGLEEVGIALYIPALEDDGQNYPGGVQLRWEIELPYDCEVGEEPDGLEALLSILRSPGTHPDGFDSFDEVCGDDGVYRVISTALPLTATFDFEMSIGGSDLPATIVSGQYTVSGELHDIERDETIATVNESFEIVASFDWSISLEDAEDQPENTHIGNEHTVVATVSIADGPIEGVEVSFAVVDGPNEDAVGFINDSEDADNTGLTNNLGQIAFTYTGENPNTDTIRATITDSRVMNPDTWDELTHGWYSVTLSIDPSEDTTSNYYDSDQFFWTNVLLIHEVVSDVVETAEIVQILEDANGIPLTAVGHESLAPFADDIMDAIADAGYNRVSLGGEWQFSGTATFAHLLELVFDDGNTQTVINGIDDSPAQYVDASAVTSSIFSSVDLEGTGTFIMTARIETTDEVYELSSTKTVVPLDTSTTDTLAFDPDDQDKLAFIGHDTTMTAMLSGENSDPIEGALVVFEVADDGQHFYDITNEQGEASFTYQRDESVEDSIGSVAYYFQDGELAVTPVDSQASVEWQPELLVQVDPDHQFKPFYGFDGGLDQGNYVKATVVAHVIDEEEMGVTSFEFYGIMHSVIDFSVRTTLQLMLDDQLISVSEYETLNNALDEAVIHRHRFEVAITWFGEPIDDAEYGDMVIEIEHEPEDQSGTVTIDDIEIDIVDGVAIVRYDAVGVGEETISVTYSGTSVGAEVTWLDRARDHDGGFEITTEHEEREIGELNAMTGTITDAALEPVEGATVVLYFNGPYVPSASVVATGLTDSNGQYIHTYTAPETGVEMVYGGVWYLDENGFLAVGYVDEPTIVTWTWTPDIEIIGLPEDPLILTANLLPYAEMLVVAETSLEAEPPLDIDLEQFHDELFDSQAWDVRTTLQEMEDGGSLGAGVFDTLIDALDTSSLGEHMVAINVSVGGEPVSSATARVSIRRQINGQELVDGWDETEVEIVDGQAIISYDPGLDSGTVSATLLVQVDVGDASEERSFDWDDWVNERANLITLEPMSAQREVGDEHTLEVTLTDGEAPVVHGYVALDTSGSVNILPSPDPVARFTDASGQATYQYTGENEGVDILFVDAWFIDQYGQLAYATGDSASVEWVISD